MKENKLSLPLTIVLLGIIIAGGIFISRLDPPLPEPEEIEPPKIIDIRPVTNDDHILGNPNADIIVIEYSDFECPFCQQFHPTMSRIISEYGKNGRVAWVYRHFPIAEIHPNSTFAAVASECVAQTAGNEKFWEFSSLVFQEAPESLAPEALKFIAETIGVDGDKYESCILLDDGSEKVERDLKDGLAIYENDSNFGTPYSIIISKKGLQTQVIGAQPYEVMREIIESML